VAKAHYRHRRIGGRAGPMRLAHHIAWEAVHGEIPPDHELHHLDGNGHNNDLENLVLLTRSDHQRYHSPYYARQNGEWVIVCRRCREIKPLDEYTLKTGRNKPLRATTCRICRAAMARIERRIKSEQA
jgi:uncharacterized protein YlaI